jgi:hypothetical protein
MDFNRKKFEASPKESVSSFGFIKTGMSVRNDRQYVEIPSDSEDNQIQFEYRRGSKVQRESKPSDQSD